MLQSRSIHSSLGLKDRILSFDYVLVSSILILGITSMFAMYSTDGGEFKYHTNSHILRFCVFFGLFFFISLIKIRFWHSQSYLIYILFFLLLLGVKYFGLTSSGSKRWLDLYLMNLQPSELMKIGLILFLAKYYHRISIENINQIKFLFLPIIALVAPVILVATQPDLGTSILIAAGGITVAWLAGVRVKFFAFSGLLIDFIICITASFAPPCKGPFKDAIAPVMAPCKSDKLLVIVLAVKVDTLKLCSAYKISEISNALTISLSGTLLNIILKKFSEKDKVLLGEIIFFPFLALK